MDQYNEEKAESYFNWGIYYGYPMCCIKEFVLKRIFLDDYSTSLDTDTGFIPCETHAKQIINKTIRIEDLIKDRECKWEFPKDDEDEADEEVEK